MEIQFKIIIDDRLAALCRKIFSVKTIVFLVAVCLFAMGLFLFSEQITKPYNFTTETIISSAEVNENFNALYTLINQHDNSITSLIEGGDGMWLGDMSNISYLGNVGIGTSPINVTGNADITITGTIAQDAWTNVNFENSWVNFSPPGHNPAGYFRDKNGIVHLRGVVCNGVINESIFTLPAGYRPAYREVYAVLTSPNNIGRCDILASGAVSAFTGNNGWFTLDGITFRANGY